MLVKTTPLNFCEKEHLEQIYKSLTGKVRNFPDRMAALRAVRAEYAKTES